ncbi:MAG: hypothetical protein J1E38_05055 [Paramuribaculum sp.]|nr:hypothetical protein [Paramuribaculum sp.]
MKKKVISILSFALPFFAMSQTAMDAFQIAQPGFKGTARFMSMGGAFTALGGDISTLTQNPAGIGVYRSNDVSVTLDLNFQSNKSTVQGLSMSRNSTQFNCNNFGYVGAVYTGSDVMPYFNWGASYSRNASFNRKYKGTINNLSGSLSNLIAGYTMADGWSSGDLSSYYDNYNPYQESFAPWLSILGYNSYIINPIGTTTQYNGLWQDGTYGSGAFDIVENGYNDEYSINFGGNFKNSVMWGIGFGITDIDYTSSVYYEEDFENARIPDSDGNSTITGAGGFGLDSWKHINGTGFNVKLGLILRPVNELRIGLAVHTPTWYSLKQEGWGAIDYGFSSNISGYTEANNGYTDYFEWKLRTPWRFMAGIAGVIGSKGIISLDYEYRPMNKMSVQDRDGNEYTTITGDVETYYKGVNIVRVGAEYRIDRNWSLRAGASLQSSPVSSSITDGNEYVYTSGPDDTEMTPSYTTDNTTVNAALGFGYRYNNFYIDAAYVYETRKSTFHPYTPSNYYGASPTLADLKTNNNQAVVTIGFKF